MEDAPQPSTANAPPILAYADLPARWGVSIMRNDHGLRIVVPPVPSWRNLQKGFFVGPAVFAAVLVLVTATGIQRREPEAIPAILFSGGGLLAFILAALYRLHRRVIFDISDEEFRVTILSPLLSPTFRRWARSDVGRINRNVGNDKLVIHIPGKDMVEMDVSADPRLVEWLSDTLTGELAAAPRGVAGNRQASSQNVAAPRPRRGLFVIAGIMGVVAIATFILGFPWLILGIYLLLFSCVPIGIALVVREREYYI